MKISTSILDSDNRVTAIETLNSSSTDYIHIDVMDGIFVPNKQMNTLEEISEINNVSQKKLDIHLMVSNPLEYIKKLHLEKKNIEYVTFHIESQSDIRKVISLIKKLNYKVGIALKPNTDINKLIPFLKEIDLILILSVEPGHGGQKFIATTSKKIENLSKIIKEKKYPLKIEVDGGINNITIKQIQLSDIAVAGSYIIKSNNYEQSIQSLLK